MLNYPDWTSGYLTILALRNLCLTCSELSGAKRLGSTGAYNIIKNIPINTPFGSVIHDNEIISVDYINVSNRVLRTLHFKLVNSRGNVVDLNNVNCSFSLPSLSRMSWNFLLVKDLVFIDFVLTMDYRIITSLALFTRWHLLGGFFVLMMSPQSFLHNGPNWLGLSISFFFFCMETHIYNNQGQSSQSLS